MKIIQLVLVLGYGILISGCGGGGSSTPTVIQPPPIPPVPVEFHCSNDSTCPQILVNGDPFANDNFRGYGDPSLEYDTATDTLWMSYSWLNVLISDPGPPVVFDLGARTHLAKSVDGGQSFDFVRAVAVPEIESHPDSGVQGWSIHEVSTLVKQADGSWQVLWLKYFNPFGTVTGVDERQEFLYWKTIADSPEQLGDLSEVWGTSNAISPAYNAPINFNDIAELSDCLIQSEPALFTSNNITYLATSCLVADANGRRTDLERLVLLRQEANGYSFVGNIMDAQDATDLGVDAIEQADISVARDGSIILLVTPIILEADPSHQGCRVYEFEDFSTAQLKRDSNGVATPRTIITSDGNGLGPGLCSYDAQSDTGVLLVITTITNNSTDIEFSLRATGVHP